MVPRSDSKRRRRRAGAEAPARASRETEQEPAIETAAEALARLYDLDLAEDPGDVELYLALADRTGDPIVELGVGTGRVAVRLAAAGHTVVGLDADPAMLARAARRTASAGGDVVARVDLREADARRVAAADRGRFQMAVLALNTIFMFPERADQARVVAAMAGLVGPGGLVVVDAWQPQPADLARMDGRLSLEWLREDPETGREVTKVASAWYDTATRVATMTSLFEEGAPGQPATRWTRVDRLRLVGPDELADSAVAAGLEVERLAGDYDLEPFGSASERVILVARKPA